LKVMEKVLATLEERRDLAFVKTRWVKPASPTMEGIANADASSLVGCGGAMVMGEEVVFFSRKWRDDIREGLVADGVRIPIVSIACLEALTVVLAATTWGHLWSGRKVVLRSDRSPAVYCFDELASRDPTMSRIADPWEDVQFHFGFEGLLAHCKGSTNEMADQAIRLPEQELQAGMTEAAAAEGVGARGCRRVKTQWNFGEENVGVLDELIRLTEAAGRKRKLKLRANGASSISPLPPPHKHPRS
jgi:hypothetical protein